jgi:hypothetical protein
MIRQDTKCKISRLGVPGEGDLLVGGVDLTGHGDPP